MGKSARTEGSKVSVGNRGKEQGRSAPIPPCIFCLRGEDAPFLGWGEGISPSRVLGLVSGEEVRQGPSSTCVSRILSA